MEKADKSGTERREAKLAEALRANLRRRKAGHEASPVPKAAPKADS